MSTALLMTMKYFLTYTTQKKLALLVLLNPSQRLIVIFPFITFSAQVCFRLRIVSFLIFFTCRLDVQVRVELIFIQLCLDQECTFKMTCTVFQLFMFLFTEKKKNGFRLHELDYLLMNLISRSENAFPLLIEIHSLGPDQSQSEVKMLKLIIWTPDP